jgi:hypothetical protein
MFALERRPSGAVIIEEGRIGVSDLAVFYSADYQLALAVVHWLNGDITEAERMRAERQSIEGEMPPWLKLSLRCSRWDSA